MMVLELLLVWFALSPVLALAIGAFMKSGHGPHLEAPYTLLPRLEDGSSADLGPEAETSRLENLAA